ncbi:MAG: 16S rRNA (adenine(1518)-N(6)/adenine(1519)-N(6))-dimethyltransferase RsmA [Thermoplasmataceae archaeon]
MNQDRRYTKRYGQVFLSDSNIASLEVRSLDLPAGSHILEIGPGGGIITKMLLDHGYVVTAVESDHRFVENLTEKFSDDINNGRLRVVKGDILEFPPGEYDGIMGNVPYQISSSILFRLDLFRFKSAILMFQDEFAQRLLASPGDKSYSRISVNAQLRYIITPVRRVPRTCFTPVPMVNSRIIRLTPREDADLEELRKADLIFKDIFSKRRKKLSTILDGLPENIGVKRVDEFTPGELLNIAKRFLTGKNSPC